ncbi:hypothetical protein FZEAL_1249 [Fusarium zealandicum]|uniref:Bacteriophage T5 Orf172 DNA-binding domain-containing protein n=1 Tax=Fusarium zealandicum TaxID=1053134 RepID=A0A8H4UT38_9HYPO|nr:hypothetical protein FZEAL_1249 [Fusarium zealandicum]
MATTEKSTPPVLEELRTFIVYFPSLDEPSFSTCRGYVDKEKRQCLMPAGPERQRQAKILWGKFTDMAECPDDDSFYENIEELLKLIHCRHHHPTSQSRFKEWQSVRSLETFSSSPGSSAPVTPEPRSSVEFPSETDMTPFSSPITADETLMTPMKSPGSVVAESIFQETPTKIKNEDGKLPKEEPSPDASDDTASISTTSISARSEPLMQDSRSETREAVADVVSAKTIPTGSECPEKEPPSESKEDVVVETASITTVTETIESKPAMTEGDPLSQADVKHLSDGLDTLQRKGSLRDGSSIVRELYKYLTPEQHTEGVVYIVEHAEDDARFAVGWTSTSAQEILNKPDNCYGADSKIIHETSQGSFQGASKAQKLAQVILRQHNTRVRECTKCTGGHTEWLQVPKETVCNTVRLMEDFIRLPAYELQDGEMKLSPAAHVMVKTMCNFSTGMLETLLSGVGERSAESEMLESSTTTQVEEHIVTNIEEPLESTESLSQSTTTSDSKTSGGRWVGRKLGTSVAGFQNGLKKTKRILSTSFLSRSRESTPGLDNEEEARRARERPDSSKGPEDMMVRFLFTLLPGDDDAADKNVTGDEGPRDKAALIAAVRQMKDGFLAEYNAAKKEGSAEPKATASA